MALTEKDLQTLRLLLQQELRAEIRPFRTETDRRFDEIRGQIDQLYLLDEKREQEYLAIYEQIRRLERKFA